MCSARVYPLEALMADCRAYFQATGRRVTFEYTLLAGVNDSPAQVGHGDCRSYAEMCCAKLRTCSTSVVAPPHADVLLVSN